jgi:hypothetical protein
MDNYPEKLDPPRDEWGAIDKSAFKSWWSNAAAAFPTVPENVAQYWLHEHWGRSPYSKLKSRAYEFELVAWPCERIVEIYSTWDDYDPTHAGCLIKGEELVTTLMLSREMYPTARYMLDHGNFPAPIIVLDNRDGHHNTEYPQHYTVPDGYVLMEGHARFNIATYLQKIGRLNKTVDVWMMKKRPSP